MRRRGRLSIYESRQGFLPSWSLNIYLFENPRQNFQRDELTN